MDPCRHRPQFSWKLLLFYRKETTTTCRHCGKEITPVAFWERLCQFVALMLMFAAGGSFVRTVIDRFQVWPGALVYISALLVLIALVHASIKMFVPYEEGNA
ncbi:hypothetical protein LJB83_02240 [Clostridia bacterium OttesenSCG-928-F22]|nr:hypothetical protein [Clostridia bacterium OttesenSCG-928-F22]